MKHTIIPAIETNEFTRPCLPAEAYPVLWKLAAHNPVTRKRGFIAVLRAIFNPTNNHTTNNNH